MYLLLKTSVVVDRNLFHFFVATNIPCFVFDDEPFLNFVVLDDKHFYNLILFLAAIFCRHTFDVNFLLLTNMLQFVVFLHTIVV